jgi:hypothetical protein
MSAFWTDDAVLEIGTLTHTGTTAITKSFGRKVKIKRLILVTTTAVTVADDTVTVGKRKVDNTAVSPASVGTFVVPFTGSALNDVKYVELAEPSTSVASGTVGDQIGRTASVIYKSVPGDYLSIDPDEELYVTPGGTSSAGVNQVWAEYIMESFDPEADYVDGKLAFTPA